VIGAGHNGLVLATYLARCGLRILLMERRLRFGGGLSTEEVTLPGFLHNLHSVNHFAVTSSPWYRDLELHDLVPYIRPTIEFAQPHRDSTALIMAPDLSTTLQSLEQFSTVDTRTFARINPRAELWARHILLPERYSEPLPDAQRRQLWGSSDIGREFLSLTDRMPLDVIKDLFENDRVRTLLLFKLSIFGTILNETEVFGRSPTGTVVRALELTNCYELCRGGSWNLARGLMQTFLLAGGTYRNQSEVSRIMLEGGQVTGVELSTGDQFRARFVASTLGPHQTFYDCLGERQLPPALRARIDRFKYTAWGLFGAHYALKEAPHYGAASANPLVDRALKYHLGEETLEDIHAQHQAITEQRILPRPQFGAGALTVLDPSQAPHSQHTAYAWQPMPAVADGKPGEIDAIKDDYARRMLEVWHEYAPNMTPENVLATYTYTPYDYSQILVNMRGGDVFIGAFSGDQVMDHHFGYRTEIPGLYMAGSSVHPGGAISGGPGYIAAGVIADDLSLKRWWPRIRLEEHAEMLRAAAVTVP